MKRNTLYIMVGLPAAGKSTWISMNQKLVSKCVVVSLDQIRRLIFGHQFHDNAEPYVIAFAKSMVKILLMQNKNVIIDATNIYPFVRTQWRTISDDCGSRKELIIIDTPLKLCIERNRKRSKKTRVPYKTMKRFATTCVFPDGIEKSLYDGVRTTVFTE